MHQTAHGIIIGVTVTAFFFAAASNLGGIPRASRFVLVALAILSAIAIIVL